MRRVTFRLTTPRQRSFVSSLFVLTFCGTVLTVLVPCPAQKRRREAVLNSSRAAASYGETNTYTDNVTAAPSGRTTRRWIEETLPPKTF